MRVLFLLSRERRARHIHTIVHSRLSSPAERGGRYLLFFFLPFFRRPLVKVILNPMRNECRVDVRRSPDHSDRPLPWT